MIPLNAEVAYCGHVTTKWFARGHYFPTLETAAEWARLAFKPGCAVRLFDERTGASVANVTCVGMDGKERGETGKRL